MNREAMFEVVRQALVETLVVEADEVTPEANFFEDLGGESIDSLDFAFRIEKAIGVKIPIQAVERNLATDSSGKLTEQSLEFLKRELPYLAQIRSLEEFGERPVDLFRVDVLVEMALQELHQKKSQLIEPGAK